MRLTDVPQEPNLLARWVLAALDRHRPLAIRHPLGFICLPLARDELNLCVHVWAPSLGRSQPTTSPVHCHSWDLTSHILYGSLSDEQVHVNSDPSSPTHRVFEIRSDGDVDHITPTNRLVRWRRARTAHYRTGETYHLPAGSFHMTAVPIGQEAATVVCARVRKDLVDLSLGGLDLAGHTVARRHCGPHETDLAIAAVCQRLTAHQDKLGRPA